ncbi:aminotransferase class V-fold PLP-dependent enzyme [Chryseolinea lacunae]|uniref:phosphoserine transaminase n=1 Tax=Chryseolinea lacunae TaxID=2801331 RepID=A0ABS1KN68_9BACT|nr:aminotransferase class V-fold PLP-dependent enzyme [Chryseolinea lacunae]MBL0740881.1 alanine--glyoxylate aminotransferase family protein [Chryseolinea lacunae]
MISFYPGPSRVHDEIPAYVKDAHKLGIMSINHRSDVFVTMSERTITLLKEKLNIPQSYTVFFTGSATECWEIIAQSLITDKSFHFYNGAFGQKWHEYTHRLHPGATAMPFGMEEKLDAAKITINDPGVICITQNETSNGTQVPNAVIRRIKKNHPEHLVAVDATSSMAGIALDFKAADIWFASVQKCFGLPAGLGLMICSPDAIDRAAVIAEKEHYNSLTFMTAMMAKWQTPFTPNVLGIYLLMRVLEDSRPIKEVQEKVVERYNEWVKFLAKRKKIAHLITNQTTHSHTVVPVTGEAATLQEIKALAKKEGLLLGEGYGEWKATTFRIANFPALKKKEIKTLMKILKDF